MMMKKNKTDIVSIPLEVAEKEYGITFSCEQMPNKELRFRLRSADGSAYIRTVSSDEGGWQNSHFHKFIKETYIVQKGWMAIAILKEETMEITIYNPDEVVTIEPFVVHNVYLPARSVIHTVKHGITKEKTDWYSNEELDKLTKKLDEQDIIR